MGRVAYGVDTKLGFHVKASWHTVRRDPAGQTIRRCTVTSTKRQIILLRARATA